MPTTAHDAAANGDLAAMLQYGDLSQCLNDKKETVMHTVVQNNHLHLVDFLLHEYPEFARAQDIGGDTILHVAATKNFLDMVNKLLDFDVDLIDIRNHIDQTPLQCAIRKKRWDCALLMISGKPASIYQMDLENRTLLHHAVFHNGINFVTCFLKVCPSAILTYQDTFGKTPLHYAVEESLFDLATRLVHAEPKAICIPDAADNPPVFLAPSVEMLKMMLHANPDAIFHQSERHGNILCKYLWPNNAGFRAQAIEFLVRLKPGLVNDVNMDGDSVLDVAFMLQRKNDINTILRLAQDQQETKPQLQRKNEINTILRLAQDQQETKPQGNTLLHFAAYAGDIEICKQIFTSDVERLYCKNMQQKTPLDMAVECKHCDVVRMFVPNITIDMALQVRKLCLANCKLDLLDSVVEQCSVLNNYLLPDLATMVLEYFWGVFKNP